MSMPGKGGLRADAVRNRQLALEAATELLAEPDTVLTVEAIAKRADLGAGTVVRAFGGKDALLDAAVAELLQPIVRRAQDLCEGEAPDEALRTFLAELIDFQAAHHGINDKLTDLNLPSTTARRAELVAAVEEMIGRGRRAGVVRSDLDAGLLTTLVGQTAFAIARTRPAVRELTDAYLTVLMDGLRPRS
ncbi:TetR/AcrR family transcriptional regulator [Streptomyces sp. Root264]|uniref:TetR/AcrR family transcriptional regulator n=1 Tax=Streptomyces sp. Root264 TaxID=1736503 RepID=UPI000A472AEC|nr:TetR/AcrR family transcriptional regulator [Streptomyces sp. Root264]